MKLKVECRRLVDEMPEQRRVWRTFGVRLFLIAGAFAFSIWATVRSHPEQDLPLWPAWLFGAVAVIGVICAATAAFGLGPFRGEP
jgi:hypothetical protein